jgi:hypothetical protein
MAEEIVYIGDYDNTIDLRLDSDGTAIPLDSVTQIDANIEGVGVTSANAADDLIRWDQLGYAEGEIRCQFGAITDLPEGHRNCWFIVYDPTNPHGVVFGPVKLWIIQLPEVVVP